MGYDTVMVEAPALLNGDTVAAMLVSPFFSFISLSTSPEMEMEALSSFIYSPTYPEMKISALSSYLFMSYLWFQCQGQRNR